jgi:hypothetical protein
MPQRRRIELELIVEKLGLTRRGWDIAFEHATQLPLPRATLKHQFRYDMAKIKDWYDGAPFHATDTKLQQQFDADENTQDAKHAARLTRFFLLTHTRKRLFQKLWFKVITRAIQLRVATACRKLDKQYPSFHFSTDQFLWPDPLGDALIRSKAGAAALDELTDDEKATVIDGLAAASVLSQEFAAEAEPVEVDDAAVRAYYDENVEQFSAEESCARHILVTAGDPESGVEPTEEEVAAARTEIEEIAAEIDAGGDFATLAAERSDDTGSAPDGGDLSCNPRETFIPEFDEALWGLEVGAVSGPVESEAGVHLILVYDRRTPTFDDVAEEIRAQLESQSEQDTQAASQAGFEAWFSEAVTAADVTVDPRYGTWGFFTIDQETGTETEVERDEAMFARVVPPGGPTTTTGSTLPLVDPLAPPITTE